VTISKFRKQLSLLLVIILLFVSTLLLSNSSFITSAEPNCDNPGSGDLDYCIEKIQNEIDALKPAHEYNKQELANLRIEVSSLNKQINGLSAQLNTVEKNIGQREEDLAFAQEIFEAKANSHYKFLRLYDPILPFLSSNSASEAFREISFRQKAADEDRMTMEAYAEDLIALREDKEGLERNSLSLAAIKKKVGESATFLAGEVASVETYLVGLSSKQQELLTQKFASLPVPHLAYTSLSGCVSDIDVNPGFSPRFAFFSFGVPNKVGLNQYGAKGRAEAGQSYNEILSAYYDNFQIVDYRTDITITVNGTNEYKQVFNNETMNIEEYLKHLYEMPTNWDSKALQAQAIAARSYALSRTNDGQSSIPPDQSGQVVKKELNDGNWISAVEATRGKVMVSSGNPISAWYSSTHGGFVLKSGEIGWSDTAWTKHAVDAGSGSSISDLQNTAYDRSSPWFYCDWGYRSQYSNTAWLTEDEVVDIVNAFILWDLNHNTFGHLSQTDKSMPDTWDGEKVKQEIVNEGGVAISSISTIGVGWDSYGISQTITVNGRSFNAQNFKNLFNLRAPGNIQIKPTCVPDSNLSCKTYALFNVERK